MNHKTIKATALKIDDATILISMHNNDGDTCININAEDIYSIKIRRKAFWTGMEIGVASGFLTGLLIVAVSSKDSSSFGTVDVIAGLILGIPAAVPGAIIGSIISTITTKRNFKIIGDVSKFNSMHTRLRKAEDFFK